VDGHKINMSKAIASTSQPALPAWGPVRRIVVGGLGPMVTAKASLRWWSTAGTQHQVKGWVTLQSFSTIPMFRISYSGKHVVDGDMDADGVDSIGNLYLPIDAGKVTITRSQLNSEHTSAHGIRMTLPINCDGLSSMQLIIPVTTPKLRADATLFGDALEEAEIQRLRHFRLS